jgi:anthranilate synthase/aminodeoxychorismate synthase-like glutamine amidotransferase
MRILLVDHEDSFVFNLDQALRGLGARVDCVRYTTSPGAAMKTDPDAIVFSPGPGHPADRRVTGLARALLDRYAGRRPILGVCLGHQLIGDVYGASVVRAPEPVHGEVESVAHNADRLYRGVPSPFAATRYHSLVVDRRRLPQSLQVTAWSPDGVTMGLKHRRDPTFGVQYHPESYLTRQGPKILANFVAEARR